MKTKFTLIFVVFCSLVFLYCPSKKNVKNQSQNNNANQTKTTQTGCANFANLKGHKLQKAIIIDFVNITNDTQYDYLSSQIADKLYRNLNRCFVIFDNSYIREYIKENQYKAEDLRNKETIKKIGIYFDANLVIYGTFSATPTEVMIIGEITSVDKSGIYNDFQITCGKDKVLSSLDELSNKASNIASTTFPPQEINDKLIIKEASNVVSIIKVVEKYQKGEEVSYKATPKDNSLTVEEVPSPRPEWTWKTPLPSKSNIYFVGQAMEQPTYELGFNSAIQDAYLAMSRAVGKKINSAYSKRTYRGPKGSYEQVTGNIIVKTLNYVRGDKIQSKYYRKLKDGKYEVCVLYKISFADFRNNIAESVKAEAEKISSDKAIAEANKAKAEAENAIAEADKAKAEADKANAELQLLKMLKIKEKKIASIEQEKPSYLYTESSQQYAKPDKKKSIKTQNTSKSNKNTGGFRELMFGNKK